MNALISIASVLLLTGFLSETHGAQLRPSTGNSPISTAPCPATLYFLPENATCIRGGNFDYPKCSPGLWCLGLSPSRCKRRSDLYGPCGTEYQECGQLLMCRKNMCLERPYQHELYLEDGYECSEFSHKKCLPGLWCVNGKCARLSPCGEACDPPRVRCRPGLKCEYLPSSAFKVCVRDTSLERVPVLQKGDFCSFKAGAIKCRGGTRCVSDANGATCQKTRHVGEECSVSQQCEIDRICATVRGRKVCIVERDYGDSCDPDHLAICTEGLECFSGECSTPV